jgi:hypothetical protein
MTQAPAGWYPDGQGNNRYWDGEAWTDNVQPITKKGAAIRAALTPSTDFPAGTVWSAVGKPLAGIGAGRYHLDEHHLYFEKGTLRTDSQQIPIADVIDVDVRQTITQKTRGVFNVYVRVQRGQAAEVVTIEDIADGRTAQRIINETAHAARLRRQQQANTMTYNSAFPSVAPTPESAPSDGASSGRENLLDTLTRLGDLHAAGVLTDDEFTAAKAKLLS